jgi:hypothetical protein
MSTSEAARSQAGGKSGSTAREPRRGEARGPPRGPNAALVPTFHRATFQGGNALDSDRFVRTAGLWCIVGGLVTAVGGGVTASITSSVPATDVSSPYTPDIFRVTQVLWALGHALMFLGTLGLVRSGAAGISRLGRIGLALALVGMGAIVPCQLAFALAATETETSTPGLIISSAIGLATMVAALGFLLAGIAVLQTGRWHGWHRFTPLACGLIPLVALLPSLAFAPDYFLWPLAAWSACFIFLGLALYQQPVATDRAALSAVSA